MKDHLSVARDLEDAIGLLEEEPNAVGTEVRVYERALVAELLADEAATISVRDHICSFARRLRQGFA